MTPEEWVELAEQTIVEVLNVHTSATVRELEARVSNRDWPGYGGIRIDPDFLSEARRNLEGNGDIESLTRPTKGFHDVTTYHLTGRRNKAAIEETAARKRLLTARHAGWSLATKRRPKGLIGEAGERVLINVLSESDKHSSVRRDTSAILGQDVQGGTFDTTSYLTIEEQQRPRVFTVVTEVKNQREWLYPTNPELHKFLYKSATLSQSTGDTGILPVFISPFRSSQAYQLGRLFGYFAVRSEHQWVLDRTPVTQDGFTEVRDELGFQDLRLGEDSTVRFTRALTESLERNADVVSERWAATAAECADLFDTARLLKDAAEIGEIIEEARTRVERAIGAPPGYQPITGPRQ